MMTMSERARLGGLASARIAAQKAERLRAYLEAGDNLKRAAYKAGMGYRTANRYTSQWRKQGAA